jgi:hypothetical protein
MGIQIETTIYGPQIGRALAEDHEEFAYALGEMADNDPVCLGAGIAATCAGGMAAEIVTFLRRLADAIDEEDL